MASGHKSFKFTLVSSKMASGHRSLESSSEESVDYPCSPCAESGRTRQAVKYCVECQDYYCKSCIDSLHNSLPALRKHKLLSQTDFSSSSGQQNLPSVPTERCKIHSTKLIDMYCKGHDEIGCTSCMTLDHRTCKEVHTIPDIIAGKKTAPPDPVSVKKAIQSFMTKMQQEKNINESKLKQLDLSRQEAIKSVKCFGKKMKDTLVKLEKASIQQIEAEHVTREKVLKDDLQRVNDHIDNLTKAMNKLATTEVNKAQMFVSLKSAEKILRQTVPRQSSTITSEEKTDIIYLIDSEMEEILYRKQSFGNIEPTTLHEEEEPEEDPDMPTRINVQLPEEDKCCIVGCCYSPQTDELVVIDSYNKRLKRIKDNIVINYCDLPAVPKAVCYSYGQIFNVLLADNSIIHATLEDTAIRLCCNVKPDVVCRSICYCHAAVHICDGSNTLHLIYSDY